MTHGEPSPGWIGKPCRDHSYSEGLVCSVCYKQKMDDLGKAICLLQTIRAAMDGVNSSKMVKVIDDLIGRNME